MEQTKTHSTFLGKIVGSRQLLRSIAAARQLISNRGESNSTSMALDIMVRFAQLSETQRGDFFTALAGEFSPDPAAVLEAAQAYSTEPNARNLIDLTKVCEPPLQELLRRINRAPGGTQAILAMRCNLLKILDKRPDLLALDHDFRHLLTSWFNPGFLTMHRVDWRSPAHVLEKIIQHEAVHEIDGWDDLRRRLQPDRRCFAFFHHQLEDEPLIFVEVALLNEVPGSIGPLVDKKSMSVSDKSFRVAAFYSISNCQPGLRGVSLGNFLIKRVAEQLKREIPNLKTFVTLSPIPGFINWATGFDDYSVLEGRSALATTMKNSLQELDLIGRPWMQRLAEGWETGKSSERERKALLNLSAIYLTQFSARKGGNPVAKFHLGNGAQLFRVNWAADLSKKGLRESAGIMVNYLYDLDRLEENRERFLSKKVVHARSVTRLLE